jgi:hypothetical protein
VLTTKQSQSEIPRFRLEQRLPRLWLAMTSGVFLVFHDLAQGGSDLRDVLQPVLAALEDIEPVVEVPLAAKGALNKLARKKG